MTQKAGQEPRRRKLAWRHPAGLIFLLALTVRVALILALGTYQHPERTEVVNIAIKFAETSEFADAYGPGTGPTAHTSPLYPLLLSCIFRLFGTGQAGELAQEIFSSLIASVACAFLPSLALALQMSRSTGVWAGLCATLLPVNFWAETKGSFEEALSGLALVVICLYFALTWQRQRFSLREACAGGLIAGAAFLTSPSAIPVVALLLAIGAWLFWARIREYALWAGVFTGLSIILLLPWAIRNQHVLGSPIFTRSSLGLQVMLSNNDLAHADYHENESIMLRSNNDAHAEVARMGEPAFNREQMRRAVSWVSEHPKRFLELTSARFALFWFPRMVRTPQTVLMRCEAIAGIAGFLLILRTDNRAKWIIGAVWLGYPLIYYFVEAFARYRYPIDWSFVLLGAFAATSFSAVKRSRSSLCSLAPAE